MKRYAVKYTMSFDNNNGKGWLKEEIDQSVDGLADAFLLFSIVREEGVGTSIKIVTRDDENNKQDLTGTDLFKCWLSLADEIINFPETNFVQKYIVQSEFRKLRDYISEIGKNYFN